MSYLSRYKILKKLKRLYGEHKYREFKSSKAGSKVLKEYWKGRKQGVEEAIELLETEEEEE